MPHRFQNLERYTDADIEAAISRNAPDELPFVPIIVALCASESSEAAAVCIRLSQHDDPYVRGNAVLSLGHIARRFRSLDKSTVKSIVEKALMDPSDHVRSLAKSAADEIHQFLHWNIKGHTFGI